MSGYDEMPTSAAQRSIWFAERLDPGTPRYHVPAILEVDGDLDRSALAAAVQALLDRHEALRTGIVDAGGVPVQRVYASTPADYAVIETAGAGGEASRAGGVAADAVAVAVRQPFDLAGPTLLRVRVVPAGERRHLVAIVAHHLVCDAWSSALLLRDLGRAYGAAARGAAPALGSPPVQFADFAVWEAEILTADRVARYLDHWRAVLDPLPEPLALPAGRTRRVARGPGRAIDAEIGEALADRIDGYARAAGTTSYAVILTGLGLVLGRLAGQTEVVIGCVVATRDRAELADVVGCLVNTVPVRVSTSGGPTFDTLVREVGRSVMDGLDHRHLPFGHVVEGLRIPREAGRLPLCDVLVTMRPGPPMLPDLPGLSVRVRRAETATAKADLTVEIAGAADGGIALHLEFDATVLDPELAQWTVSALTRALSAATAHPGRPVPALDLTTPDERAALIAAASGPPLAGDRATMWQRFAAAAAQQPSGIAVRAPDRVLTYRTLAAEAQALAGELVRAGVRTGDRVGVCTARTSAWPVALLGVLRSGAAFLPLDQTLPAARLRTMIDDAQARVVVTDDAGAVLLPEGQEVVRLPLAIGASDAERSKHSNVGFLPEPAPGDLAYVIYTSGSTGRPKGVAIEHASLVGLLDSVIDLLHLGPADRILQFSSPGFDAAVLHFGMALACGGALVMADEASMLAGPVLRDTLRSQRISCTLLPPSVLALLPADEPLPDLRILLAGGEVLGADLVARWAPGRRLVNVYGPTETTIWATIWEAGPTVSAEPPPIGRPLPGVTAHILDDQLRPVPAGLPGELYLGGSGVARGYLNRPELTAERFLSDPFAGPPGRIYRTGDRVIRNLDGELMFVGRVDDQVKIRGFRVEPAEAEHVLRAHPDVVAAAVIARRDRGEPSLAGYYVPRPGAALPAPAVRAFLAEQLPAYLIPVRLVALDRLPLTPNGKLDRAALPAPSVEAASRPPGTPLERDIAAIWCEVLGLDSVGAEDNFFDVGGQSLALAQVHSRLCALTGSEVPIVDLFLHTTVAALAAHLAGPVPRQASGSGPDPAAGVREARARGEARRAALVRQRQVGGG